MLIRANTSYKFTATLQVLIFFYYCIKHLLTICFFPGEFYLSTDSIKDDINGAAGAYAIMKLERSMEKTLSGKFTEMADIALKNGHNDTP